jgi:hypothetical protein
MGKVSNLRQFRKRKVRDSAERLAAENRVRFGRTPEQRKREEELRSLEEQRFEQLRRDIPDEDR